MRANLIQQFGEKEGRRRVRLLVIDGMKLFRPLPAWSTCATPSSLPIASTLGFEPDQIWAAFAKRGLGALAMSDSGESRHIAASFDKPRPRDRCASLKPAT